MNYCVMKFGGTATATKKNRNIIATIVKKSFPRQVILIVSAMGRRGFPYATDTLKDLVEEQQITNKEYNRLLASGEIISSIVLANHLNNLNIHSYALSLLELNIRVVDQKISMDQSSIKEFKDYDCLIVPGFAYLNNEGDIGLFERGGSDLTAVIVSNHLQQTEVTLYKDVDGVYPFIDSINRNKVNYYKQLSYDEALALCLIGFQIVQKDALEYAKNNNISIKIKNYLKDEEGTLISLTADGRDILGVSFNQDTLLIATLNSSKMAVIIEQLFSKAHLFYKKKEIFLNHLVYCFGINQLQIAKKIIMTEFFK